MVICSALGFVVNCLLLYDICWTNCYKKLAHFLQTCVEIGCVLFYATKLYGARKTCKIACQTCKFLVQDSRACVRGVSSVVCDLCMSCDSYQMTTLWATHLPIMTTLFCLHLSPTKRRLQTTWYNVHLVYCYFLIVCLEFNYLSKTVAVTSVSAAAIILTMILQTTAVVFDACY